MTGNFCQNIISEINKGKPFYQKQYFDESYFFDFPSDVEGWFDIFNFDPYKGGSTNTELRFLWRAYNAQNYENCPNSLKTLQHVWGKTATSISVIISFDEGSPHSPNALSGHSDDQIVYAFNAIGKTVWQTALGDFEIEPLDLLVNPADVYHEVKVLEYPRVSFGIHAEVPGTENPGRH